MTYAELVSELLYAGKTLAEVATYNVYQLRDCLLLARDKFGRLIRVDPDLPSWVRFDENGRRIISNPQPFGKVYRDAKRRQGLTAEETEQRWGDYLEDNPGLARLVAREKARQERKRKYGM